MSQKKLMISNFGVFHVKTTKKRIGRNPKTKKEYDILVKSIKRVLKKAIKAGGTSISDFKNLDGGVGYFSQKLKIYGLDECGICGEKTYNITIAGRSSYYCKKCQR